MKIVSLDRLIWLVMLGTVALLGGCFPAATIPVPVLEYSQTRGAQENNLLVLIRGLGASNKVFEENGLIEEVRRRNLPFDIVAPDLHFGYYKEETVQERLHEDVILPARRAGYQKIWLAGFSMGGLGSLFYLRDYPDQVDGVMLICPFIGWGGIVSEVKDAGGVSNWNATTEDENDWQRLIWSWIKEYDLQQASYPPIYLGFGENDFLSGDGPELFARVLPAERSFSVPGGHRYSTFRTIFLTHLERLDHQLRSGNDY